MRWGASVLGCVSARVPTAGTWEVPLFSFWVSFPSHSKQAVGAALVHVTNTRFPKARSPCSLNIDNTFSSLVGLHYLLVWIFILKCGQNLRRTGIKYRKYRSRRTLKTLIKKAGFPRAVCRVTYHLAAVTYRDCVASLMAFRHLGYLSCCQSLL